MTAIGVIDDRDKDREMIVSGIRLGNKEDGWIIVDDLPLPSLDEYPAWISQNKICALVIDELLDEKIIKGVAVDYRGHDLVDYIRKRIPTLPIFVITAHANDDILQERFKDVEEIIARDEFGRLYKNYVPRIIRSAQQYLNIFQNDLNELSIIAQKTAMGEEVSFDEYYRAQAIKTKLDIAFTTDDILNISNWLEDVAILIDKIEKLRKDIESKLGE